MALGDKDLDKLVKPGLLEQWKDVKPQWFVIPNSEGVVTVEQKRQPGLLKVEYAMDKGSAVMVCSKTYNLKNYGKSGESKKTALKGIASDNATIRHQDFLNAIYQGTNKVTTDCNFKFNSTGGKMQTLITKKKAMNPIYTKLRVDSDNVSCTPLFTLVDGEKHYI